MKEISVVGIDLAKASFQIHANDKKGRCVQKKTLKRHQVQSFFSILPPCIVAFESGGSANYWGNMFRNMGHEVRSIPPQFVKPLVRGNKNDKNDAKAIAEAAMWTDIHFVPLKQPEQISQQVVHRIRQRRIKERTALVNEIRGFLYEYGIVMSKSVSKVKETLTQILDVNDETYADLPAEFRDSLVSLQAELLAKDELTKTSDKRITKIAQANSVCERLQSIPGVGEVIATAIVASIGDGRQFKNGRCFAAWLGLVPGHSGTGGAKNNRIGGITKRGNPYLRQLIIHGSRSALIRAEKKEDPGSKWAHGIRMRRGWNKACVALANKNARMIWAVLTSESTFDQRKMAKAA